MNNYLRLVFSLLLICPAGPGFAVGVLTPGDACAFLDQHGLHTAGGYSEFKPGQFRCNSLRKPIIRGEPPKSDVRYIVTGSASAANKLVLELRMRSGRAPQQVLILFSQYVEGLLGKVLKQEVPDDISSAIRSATPGEWQMAGKTLQLKRVHDRANTYDLVFSVK